MLEDSILKSVLAPYIEGLLKEKRSLGRDYGTEEKILLRLDRYCAERNLATINVTKDFLGDWCGQSETEGVSFHGKRISVARQLMLYMASLGIDVYLPKNELGTEVILPHLLTDDEKAAFFRSVDGYVTDTLSHSVCRRMANEYVVLFRMLYCCGLRNGEGCGLPSDSVDLETGVLTIRNAKGKKDRLVYMRDDLTELCRTYHSYLCNLAGFRPVWFFPGRSLDQHLRNTTVDRAFNRFWECTPQAKGCGNKPTVHDLRFTFVTDRINEWARQDIDVDTMMPYLSRYVGHKRLQETYYYYHTSEELYESIRKKDKTSPNAIPEVSDYE